MKNNWRCAVLLQDHEIIRQFFISLIFLVSFIGNKTFAQQADFTVSVTSGCLPLTVNFTDASTGTITSRTWDFGNGNPPTTGNNTNPSAIYSAAGTYTVSLTVSDGTHSDTKTKTGLITVHGFPVVDFSYSPPAGGCAPFAVGFTDNTNASAGALTNWLWVFGDGGTSTQKNPSYTYNNPGSPFVSLKVKNEHGCESTKVSTSSILVKGPTVNFTASPTSACDLPASISFSDHTTGTGPFTYSWDFKDGGTSTSANPSHPFTTAGAYQVVETVRDGDGCENRYSLTINAGSEGGLNFIPSALKICVGDELSFDVQPVSPITSYEWSFGDGTSSTDSEPTVFYNSPGIYSITLKAKLVTNTCSSIVTKQIEVTTPPTNDFTYTVDCDYNVTFTNKSVGFQKLSWSIANKLQSVENTFTYAFGVPGSYTITLITYNSTNCSTTLERDIILPQGPAASFLPDKDQDCLQPSLSGCAPFSLQFTNTSSSSSSFTSAWDFGDGSTSSSANPLHTFGKGTFIVKLTIQNQQGCSSTTVATVRVADVTPVAKFTIDKSSACAGEEVTFTDASQNANYWCWDFGDGSKGTGSVAKHKYQKPGIYNVTLIAKNAGCSNSFTITNAIQIKDPFVDFNVVKNCTNPYSIDLHNHSANYNSLSWDFGDGNTSTTDVSNHTFTSLGNYNISLTAVNSTTHCTTIVTIPVLIQDIKADFNVNPSTPCKNAPVNFTDQSSTSTIQWVWSLGNNISSNKQNANTTYTQAGTYQANLKVFNSDGCMDQKTKAVTVIELEGKFDFKASSNCEEFTVDFRDRSTGSPSITGWSWTFGDPASSSNTDTDPNPHHVYTHPDKYAVTLTLTNSDNNTCSFTKDGAVLFNLPVADFIVSKPALCIDEKIFIINTSVRGSTFFWDLGNGKTSTDFFPQPSYGAVGKYNITLNATDKYGCTQTTTKNAFLSVIKPTAAFDTQKLSGDCPPFTTSFTDKSIGVIKIWSWDFGNGLKSALANPSNTYVKPGHYDVKLMITDTLGCTDETTSKDLIRVGGPFGSFVSDASGQSCTNKTISFNAQTTNAATHQWDFGDGTVENTASMNTSHHYDKKGNYIVNLVLIDGNGCKVAADENERITVGDTTAIEMKPPPSCLFSGDSFAAIASTESDEDIQWNWELNGVSLGTDAALQATADQSGQYILTLNGTNSSGCVSKINNPVWVQDYLSFIPNVITPNEDGYNETFEVNQIGNGKWDFIIYNRWGTTVYKESNYQGGWDGKGLDVGVYYYSIQNEICKDKIYKGPVSIIR